jgi:serine/threonine protein phosphatase 1
MASMSGRTFVIGDIHGELGQLRALLGKLPLVTREDSVVFLGDYVDRGPQSREVVEVVRGLDRDIGCKVVCLRGNHEDAWLRVIDSGWPEFVFPPGNGCRSTLRSYAGAEAFDEMSKEIFESLFSGKFFPDDVVAWFRALPFWYEDEHAIYVHAGLPPDGDGGFLHPSEAPEPKALLWTRSTDFFRNHSGKRVVVGHTATTELPPELSSYTVDDPTDLWAGPAVFAIDTGAGRADGFLTALELPAAKVYESR